MFTYFTYFFYCNQKIFKIFLCYKVMYMKMTSEVETCVRV